MRRRRRRSSFGRRRRREKRGLLLAVVVILAVAAVAAGVWFLRDRLPFFAGGGEIQQETEEDIPDTPEEVLQQYFRLLSEGDYNGMYEMLDENSLASVTKEDFITRNQNIYEGIGASAVNLTITEPETESAQKTESPSAAADTNTNSAKEISYVMTMNSVAGSISFENKATLVPVGDGWRLVWSDQLIFPELTASDSVRISTENARRGGIYDRNGDMLAGNGVASSVGLVPGKCEDTTVKKLAKVLGVSEESIEKQLSASWVREDSFVPIKTVEKLTEQELMQEELTDEVREKQKRNEKLMEIPGVLVSDVEVRTYPLGAAAAHLIGYVQNISAEELEADTEGFYSSTSQIGKVGLESLYEERLRGKPGKKIRIVTADGNTKKVLAVSNAKDGEDITLTIDASLQQRLYRIYRKDKSTSVAMNPYTGEVLALVSTPSYDTNAFILGLSQEIWDSWNTDEDRPLLNRFRALWTPGSTFKTVTAAIGLTTGTLDAEKDYGSEGMSWQKNSSWGSYKVTTTHEADPATITNALVLSDNVFFARAALEIGAETLESEWTKLGFGEELPFPIRMSVSTFSNEEHLTSEIQLADSGYGQGQIQINALHLAVIYTALMNKGSMLTPVLEQSAVSEPVIWKNGVFTEDACNVINSALRQVVESRSGTGRAARIDGLVLAGKTGTAEIKDSQSDTNGTELGWFAAYTPELPEEDALLLVTMVEDVKDRGGSRYVVEKNRDVFEAYCMH